MSADVEFRYRRATPDDALACNELMWRSVTDLAIRQGTPLGGTAEDRWRSSEALNRLLVEEAAEWWVAQVPASGQLVGFARSIERDGLFELTEFFVLPDRQSRGIGRALIERSFPLDVVTSGRSSRHRTCEPRPATTRPGRSPASLSSPWVALRPSQCQSTI